MLYFEPERTKHLNIITKAEKASTWKQWEALRSTRKHLEALGSTRQHQEALGSTRKHQEALGRTWKPLEALRSQWKQQEAIGSTWQYRRGRKTKVIFLCPMCYKNCHIAAEFCLDSIQKRKKKQGDFFVPKLSHLSKKKGAF